MAAVWVLVIVVGLAVALVASRIAVSRARTLAAGSRIPPFVIGITLLAIGTDLPEIANSFIAAAADHGDLIVGNSVGSTATQATLVLGVLPFVVGAFVVGARRVVRIGAVTVAALLVGAFLSSDGFLSRLDGLILIVGWIVGSVVVWRDLPAGAEPAIQVDYGRRSVHVVVVLAALTAVGGGAGASVWAFINLAEALSIPEYILAFFAASFGTSLPELVVDITALRAGARDLAIGDVMGSSFIDATLSVGVGPVLFPVGITATFAVTGSLVAAAALAIVVLTLSRQEEHNRITGAVLLLTYAAFYVVLLSVEV